MKDRRKIIVQQEQTGQNNCWSKQNTQNKNSNRKELYRQVANHLSSQQFQSGVFRKSDINFHNVSKKRHSGTLQVEYGQDQYQEKPISIYGQGHLGSNITDNYAGSIFQSRLHETKGQLSQQIVDLQKKMKRQIQRDRNLIEDYLNRLFNKYTQKSRQDLIKNFDIIVNQLNKNLTMTSKKQKVFESGLTETKQKLIELQKQFNQFTLQTQEKLEKLMNNNTDVASSIKKSFSRNLSNGEYMIDLKNSIKDIPVINNNLVEQIKAQIHETQEALKNLKYDVMYIKEELKTKSIVPIQLQKSKSQMVQIKKLNYLQEQINMLKTKIQVLQSQQQFKQKYKQLRNILQIQQQNYFGMNQTLQKIINVNIFPKLKKLQQQVQNNTIQRNVQYLKKQVVKQLQSMPIIRIKHLTQQQKQKLQRMKQLSKLQQQVYMLDQFNNIMDSFGNYLLDQNNQRIKIQEDQVYYLQHMEGIQIKIPALQVK